MERKAAWSVVTYVILLSGLVLGANFAANAAPPAPTPSVSSTAH